MKKNDCLDINTDGLNPLDDLGKMVAFCPYCGAENLIWVGCAIGGSDECWQCDEVIDWDIKKRNLWTMKKNYNK